MNLQRLACTLVMMTTMVLAGCGGGGGGGSMTGMMETPTPTPETPTPDSGLMPSVSVFDDLTVTQEVADNIVTAIGRAAEATPRAGSVTQSSNVDSSGVTADQVEVTAEYGASVPRFSVRNGTEWSIGMGEGNPSPISDTTPPWKGAELSKRIAGGTLYVDAYTDIDAPTEVTTGATYDFTFPGINVGGSFVNQNANISLPAVLNGVSGRAACTGCSYVYRTGQLEMTGGSMTFTPSDNSSPTTLTPSGTTQTTPDTDYLSGGVWLVVPDNATSADDYVFGAFVDGNDPFDQSNIMALQGTATYEGGATGVYSEKTAESTAIGYFNGDVELTANFGGTSDLGTISGSITNFEVDGEPDDGTLNLGTAPIGSQNSGFFEGAVTGSDDERTYVGNWGGQFFGNGESDGKPGSVGGTFGGSSTDDAVNFVGAFGAHKQ